MSAGELSAGGGARVIRLTASPKRTRGVFELALASISEAVAGAAGRETDWLGRVRAGLLGFLAFFDAHPRWGRLLLDGGEVRDGEQRRHREQRLLGVLTGLLEDDCPLVLGEVMVEPRLASELVAGGVLAVLRRRELAGEGERCVSLAPELLAFVVAPYLGEAAAREQLRALTPSSVPACGALHTNGRTIDLPIRLTHRTTLVLRAIAAEPGVSNRDIARAAGPIDQGQLSKLLSRLAERGLIESRLQDGTPSSWPHAWRLTAAGERVAALLDAAPLPAARRVRSST